jgi:hypothetical protein
VNVFEDEIVTEVRKHRMELLEEYGGIVGYLKHIEADRPRLEHEGWRFVDMSEILKKKRTNENRGY